MTLLLIFTISVPFIPLISLPHIFPNTSFFPPFLLFLTNNSTPFHNMSSAYSLLHKKEEGGCISSHAMWTGVIHIKLLQPIKDVDHYISHHHQHEVTGVSILFFILCVLSSSHLLCDSSSGQDRTGCLLPYVNHFCEWETSIKRCLLWEVTWRSVRRVLLPEDDHDIMVFHVTLRKMGDHNVWSSTLLFFHRKRYKTVSRCVALSARSFCCLLFMSHKNDVLF